MIDYTDGAISWIDFGAFLLLLFAVVFIGTLLIHRVRSPWRFSGVKPTRRQRFREAAEWGVGVVGGFLVLFVIFLGNAINGS